MRYYLSEKYEHSANINRLLNTLADKTTSVEDYRASFFSIGQELGFILKESLPAQFNKSTLLACASEDADWLANGFINGIE